MSHAGADNATPTDTLWPMVYEELRRLANGYLRDESPDHTLQPTALVHEAYVRLAGESMEGDRRRFFIAAAGAMRRILVDHARRKNAVKRGGALERVSLDVAIESAPHYHAYLVAVDDALGDLSAIDDELSRVVELRFFGGLTVDEIADVLDVAPMTVHRRWRTARAWLHRAISES